MRKMSQFLRMFAASGDFVPDPLPGALPQTQLGELTTLSQTP